VTAILDHIQSLERYVQNSGMHVLRVSLPDAVNGRISRGWIELRADLDPQQELCTLVHELTHWLAHCDANTRVTCTHCTIFEYEAEAVEALVMSRLGLPRSEYGPPGLPADAPTDGLLSASVVRVISASRQICTALGLAD
jgi:hypothetical protein